MAFLGVLMPPSLPVCLWARTLFATGGPAGTGNGIPPLSGRSESIWRYSGPTPWPDHCVRLVSLEPRGEGFALKRQRGANHSLTFGLVVEL